MLDNTTKKLFDEEHRFATIATIMGAVMCLQYILFTSIPPNDASTFYVPLARAFAEGDWEHAFHPTMPPLLPSLGGLLATISPIDAFTANKIVSSLFYVALIPTIYCLCVRLWPRTVAQLTAVLMILVPSMVRDAGRGLLDSGKTFFVTAIVLLLLKAYQDKKLHFTRFGVCLTGLALIRSEGFIFSTIFACLSIVLAFKTNRRVVWQTFTALGIALILYSPWLKYQAAQTGYFTPDRRVIPVAKSIGLATFLEDRNANPLPADPLVKHRSKVPQKEHRTTLISLWHKLIKQIFRGYYPLWPLIIGGVFVCWKRSSLTKDQVMMLVISGTHTVVIIGILGGTWVQERYIQCTLPIVAGFAAIGILALNNWLQQARQRYRYVPPAWVFALIPTAILLQHGVKSAYPRTKRPAIASSHKQAVDWLRNHHPSTKNNPSLSSTLDVYHNGRSPIVCVHEPRVGYYGEFETITPYVIFQDSIPDRNYIALFLRQKEVQYLLVTQELRNQWGMLVRSIEEAAGSAIFDNGDTQIFSISNELIEKLEGSETQKKD